jgi:hypothetical protein
MSRATCVLIAIVFSAAPACLTWAEDVGLFLDGRWEGSVDLSPVASAVSTAPAVPSAAVSESLILRFFPSDPETGAPAGGLVDMPSRGLFGYPIGDLERGPEGVSFSLLGDAPFQGRFTLRGSPARVAVGERYAISGSARLFGPANEGDDDVLAEGTFKLVYSNGPSWNEDYGLDFPIDTGRGMLPGSLLLPAEAEGQAVPVILLVPGAGADRDGNNYSVPGRSDSLVELASALRARGVASLRFDRRGTGATYRLAADEEKLRFDDHIADARSALRALAADSRFSSIVVAGFSEGALVGASALSDGTGTEKDIARGRISGFVAVCASGRNELEMVEDSLSKATGEIKAEAAKIVAALEAGDSYPNPSPFFADYFRPSIQPYLASLFRHDIRQAVAMVPCPVLVVAGGSDLQVSRTETELLASSRRDAAYRVIDGMSHALKEVGEDEEANYASFTDPSIPLCADLPALLAAFAKGETLPGDDSRARAAGAQDRVDGSAAVRASDVRSDSAEPSTQGGKSPDQGGAR